MARFLKPAPFEWGHNDCIMRLANYVEMKTGTHPAPHLIGSYSTAFGARRVIMQHGGMINMLSKYFAPFSDGEEFGLYELGGVKIGGISSGSHVQFQTENGVMITDKAELLKGWEI